MIIEKTDLMLPGRMPVVIHRTYNPFDPFGAVAGFQLGFGSGWSLSTEVVLQEETPSLRRLILPGNARIAFVPGPHGSFINTTDHGFAGAVLTADGQGGPTLHFRSGTTWRFASGWLARVNPRPLVGLGLLVEQTDQNGNPITIDRDTFGGITRLVDTVGRAFTFTPVASGLITDIADPLGRTVRYGYDSDQRLVTVTDPAGGVTRYTYDTSGRILTITDARGIAYLTNEYGFGKVDYQTQADGGQWTFWYRYWCSQLLLSLHQLEEEIRRYPHGIFDPYLVDRELECRATSTWSSPIEVLVTDPRGYTTVHGLVGSRITDALGQKTRFERDHKGELLSIHDPLDRKTRFEYDAAGNVTQITDPAGNIRRLEYEPTFNRLTRLTDPLGNTTTFAYDTRGNLTRITDPLGQVTQLTYNAFGQPISTTDALGQVTTFAYDAQGNLVTITDPLGNTTTRAYDTVSRLIAQTDPLGRITSFTYDALNRLTEIVDALNGVTKFTYDANDNLLTVTDALGHTTTYEYDNMDRLIRRTDPLGASESFAYDPVGNLISRTDRKGQVTTFAYDAIGRLVHASDTAGGDVLHTYDVLDRLIQQTTGLGTVAYTYDALGRRASMRVSGKAPVIYSYDNNSRLTQLTQGAQVVDFAYDALDRRAHLTLPNGVATEYSFDAASRLAELVYRNATGVLGNLTYQYDAAGNRTQVGGSFARTLLPDPVASATYDAANRQRTFGNKQMTFDANGNMTSITDPSGVTTFTWDARNRLAALTGPALSAAFTYDSLGRRSTRQVNGARTDLLYDGVNPVQELSGTLVTANMLFSLRVDEYFTRTDARGTHTLLTDALGSTLALADNVGTVQSTYMYEPYGRTTTTGTTNPNPFQYTGRENDGTGLYYYRARYYLPSVQRFISEDPLNFLGGDLNLYAYVGGNPTNYIDPTGMARKDLFTPLKPTLSSPNREKFDKADRPLRQTSEGWLGVPRSSLQ